MEMMAYFSWNLAFDLVKIRMQCSKGDVQDPLTSNPGLPIRLERFNLVKDYGLDPKLVEEKKWNFRLVRNFVPEWLQWTMNPSAELTWSVIRREFDPTDRRLFYNRYIKELEIAISEGHERVLIEPRYIGEYALDWIRIGQHTHHYAWSYGLLGLALAYQFPRAWFLYMPCAYVSMINAYCHSRYWRTDRLYRYEIFEPDLFEQGDMMPIISNVAIIREWPKHYWVLKRIGRIRSSVDYVKHQSVAVGLCLLTAYRMWQLETYYLGPGYREMTLDLKPFFNCDYYLPRFLDFSTFWIPMIPADIHRTRLTSWLSVTADQWVAAALLGFYSWDLIQSLVDYPPKDDDEKDLFAGNLLPENSLFEPAG